MTSVFACPGFSITSETCQLMLHTAMNERIATGVSSNKFLQLNMGLLTYGFGVAQKDIFWVLVRLRDLLTALFVSLSYFQEAKH